MEKLTKKEYWEKSWKNIQLPAGYSLDYSHKVIFEKIISIFSKENFRPGKIIEIGGCPGRWPDFFNKNYHCQGDVIDYGENNCEITKKNYDMLGIKGRVYNQDLFTNNLEKESYDVVISDGLVEHFTKIDLIFKKHVELLKNEGFLIVGVPNIKESFFYNYFSKKDPESHGGHRIIRVEDFYSEIKKNDLDIIFCDYLGVFNPGLVRWSFIKNKKLSRILEYFFQFLNSALFLVSIKKESKSFSPYIFLICRKVRSVKNIEENEKIFNFYQTNQREVFTQSSQRFDYLVNEIKKYKNKGKYLDIGIGDGYLIKKMAKNNFECFGVDIAKKSIDKNSEELKKGGIVAILKQGNIDSIPFKDEAFDVITASEVLEHLDLTTLKNGIQEIKGCLKKGGIFVGTVPIEENLKDNLCFCPKCENIFHKWGHQQSFNDYKLNYLFKDKFEEVKIKKIMSVPYKPNIYETIKFMIKRVANLIFNKSFVGSYLIIVKK